KGLDHDAAKASALMESIETWHGERVAVPLRYESYSALRSTHAAADPVELALSAGNTPRHDVPYLWARGWDLIGEEWTYVPYELVSTNFVFPPGYRPTFSVTTNGLASGNNLLEASTHALAEVIERDAHTLWSLRSSDDAARTAVSLDTVDDPACRH